MVSNRILVSWIGHNDLLGLAADSPPLRRTAILDRIKRALPATKQNGPIRTLVEQKSFDEIHLLSNGHPSSITRPFVKWLGVDAKIHEVSVDNPTDYQAELESAMKRMLLKDFKKWYHSSKVKH